MVIFLCAVILWNSVAVNFWAGVCGQGRTPTRLEFAEAQVARWRPEVRQRIPPGRKPAMARGWLCKGFNYKFINFNILYSVFHSNIYDYVETPTGSDTLQPWTVALGTSQCLPEGREDIPVRPVQTVGLMGAQASADFTPTVIHSVHVASDRFSWI